MTLRKFYVVVPRMQQMARSQDELPDTTTDSESPVFSTILLDLGKKGAHQ